jgi:hypothetical protein
MKEIERINKQLDVDFPMSKMETGTVQTPMQVCYQAVKTTLADEEKACDQLLSSIEQQQ